MRITFVLPPVNLSGGIRVIAIYAELLKRRGHDVRVVSVPPKKKPLRQRIKSFLRGSVERHAAPAGSHFDGVDVEHHMIDRYRPIVDHDVADGDVVVATWWETAEWVANLSTEKGAKAYFVQHDESTMNQPTQRVHATLRHSMHKITIARWLVDLLRDQFGNDDVTLVPNSVDTELFSAAQRDRREVATVGMLYAPLPVKGCDVSIRAYELARETIPNLRFVTFGATSPDEGVLPEGAKFTLRPPQDHIREIYASCDAWICGSRLEGFGLPLLEAMACRCPVVSTKSGGPDDFIDHGVTGYLVNVDDHVAMAERIVELIQMPPQQWQEMSDAAYTKAHSYTWDDATERFERGLVHAVEKEAR